MLIWALLGIVIEVSEKEGVCVWSTASASTAADDRLCTGHHVRVLNRVGKALQELNVGRKVA